MSSAEMLSSPSAGGKDRPVVLELVEMLNTAIGMMHWKTLVRFISPLSYLPYILSLSPLY